MTVTDFHSHILPATDHGCDGIAECILQLQLMSEHGTEIAVATPHFYPHIHRVDKLVESIDSAISEIRGANIKLPLGIAIGAEVLLCDGLDQMEGLERLCIRGTKTLLLEMPPSPIGEATCDTVENIISNGYTVVLAHIDRYLKSDPRGVEELLSLGAYAQINSSSFLSHSTRNKLYRYIEDGDTVCAIGSDLHGCNKKLYKGFLKAQKILGNEFEKIMSRSDKLLSGAEMLYLK